MALKISVPSKFLKSNPVDKINRWNTAADQPLVLGRGKLVLSNNRPYIPAGVVAKEFSYALSHVSLLARQKKIEAVCVDKRWYISRESVLEYRKQAEQNKVAGGLKSSRFLQNENFDKNRGSSISKPNQKTDLEEIGTSKVLLSEEHLSRRANLLSKAVRIFLGGLLIFIFSQLPLDKLPYTKAGLIDVIKNFFTAPEIEIYLTTSQYEVLISRVRNLESQLKERTLVQHAEYIPPSQISSPSNIPVTSGPKIIPKITKEASASSLNLNTLILDLDALEQRVNTLTSNFESFSTQVPTLNQVPLVFQLPDTNTKGLGPITLNPAHLVSETLTVSGASALSSTLSVLSDFSVDTNVLKVDTTNNRVGINTSSPEVAFEVIGAASISGNLTLGGTLTTSGNIGIGTTSVPNQLTVVGSGSFTGQLKATRAPVVAHTGTWPSFTGTANATLYINPSSPIADGNVIAYVSGSDPKFVVDAEGDIYGNNLILTGSTTTATQTVGDLLVEGSTQLGDAVGDKIYFVGTVLPKTLTSFPLLLKASASQTVDVFRIKDPDDNILLTVDQGTGLLTASSGFNFALGGNTATVSYSRLGTATTGHSNYISRFNDLLISGDLETRGTASFGGNASISGTFTSVNTGSNSFAGSLLISKGFNAQAIVGTGLTINGASNISGNATFDTNTLYIDATNNRVGVLTTTPTTTFEVQGTASASYLLTGNTLQVGGFASAAYSRFGISTTGHSNYISSANDLLISGDLEVKGSISANIASVSRMFISNSAASASLSFRGNGSGGTNQSMFSLGVGNGTERLNIFNNDNSPLFTIASGGNVGIGTTGPDRTFTVFTSATGGGQISLGAAANDADGVIYTFEDMFIDLDQDNDGTNNKFFIRNGGDTEVLTVQEDGNVGIGTTAPNNKLEVQANPGNTYSAIARFNSTNATNQQGAIELSSDNATLISGWQLYHKGSTDAFGIRKRESTTVTDYLTILTDGNVGIGTTGPEAVLHIKTVSLTPFAAESSDANAIYSFTDTVSGNTNSLLQLRKSRNGGVITTGDFLGQFVWKAHDGTSYNTAADFFAVTEGTIATGQTPASIRFRTEDLSGVLDERMRITPAGNVGIGTVTPGAKLDVTGSSVRIGDSGSLTFHAYTGDTSTTGINFVVGSAIGGTTDLTIRGDGNVGIGTIPGAQLDLSTDSARKLTTTTWATGSDARIKTSVESISDALDVIGKIRPVKYHFTPEFLSAHPSVADTEYYHFIAQEYQQVFPDSVTQGTDGLFYLNSSNMIPYAIAGIKELDTKYTSLSFRIDELATKTGKLASEKPVMQKVSLENGPIKSGDRLIVSSVPEIAMKATDAGMTIGVAMESLYSISSGSFAEILIFPNESFWAPSYVATTEMTDEQLGIGDPSYNIDGIFLSVVSKFSEQFGIIFEQGLIRVAKIITDIIETKKLVADELQLRDSQTGELWCVTIKNGEWDKILGECSIQATPTPSPSDMPTTASGSFEPTPEPTPVDNLGASPSPTPEPETTPEPMPDITPEPTPESTPTE